MKLFVDNRKKTERSPFVMKHIAMTVIQIINGLYQQEVVSSEQKNMMIRQLKKAISENDRASAIDVVTKLKENTRNKRWISQLESIETELR